MSLAKGPGGTAYARVWYTLRNHPVSHRMRASHRKRVITSSTESFISMTRKLAVTAFLVLLILSGVAPARAASSPADGAVEKVADGVVVQTAGGLLKLQVCADDVVRVAFAKDRAFFDRKSLAV